ncbi:hypothetical protein [Pseudorhodoferax sp. Leaf267]|uniref:hypothetical protein n=1 Tax=Pseudorhodoferax sp. Leaf267 TaxID=1736316 RepID=UPI0006F1D44A|nr:hypothetical protein [Pseudorhodoferax sp. Leaf267]KQP19581.1 hypothetical protein ASF43_28755 [Pseudorhodoferax sp. Leaf267]
MYTKLIAPCLLAAACAATPCLADTNVFGEVGYIPPVPSGSTTTREAVITAYLESLKPQQPPPPSTVKRADVVAELMRALREGTMPPYGEGSDTGTMLAQRPAPAQTQPMLATR